MKLLVTGDWQLESSLPCDRLDDNGKSIRFAENQQVIRTMLEDAKAKGCTGMVHGGDLTEERNPDSLSLTAAADAFGLALSWGWDVWGAAGNHDGALFELSSSSFEAMGKLNDKFLVYHEPTFTQVGPSGFLFVPYLHKKSPKEVMDMAIASVPAGSKVDYVFAHYAYAGVQIGAGNLILPGDHLDSSFLHTLGAKVAFFAHIHKQQLIKGDIPVVFPGSPVINNFGERNDAKGYVILDTDTGKWEFVQLAPARKWVQVDWKELGTGVTKGIGKFNPNDIVKIVGEYKVGESPQDAFKEAVKAGNVPEPFFKTFEVKRAIQTTKRGVVSSGSGLQTALSDYVTARWPKDPLAASALESALTALKSSSPVAFDKSVVLKSIHGVDFLSHKEFTVNFVPGSPLLVSGPNGIGKTNVVEGVLFAFTGQVSKKLSMAGLVRQGAKKSLVEAVLEGEKGNYRIQRTLTLNSKGAASHKVNVEIQGEGGDWTSLADGGVVATQAALGRLIGATFLSMRAVNFQFQRDPNPFIGAEPTERKAILAEILGLDAIGRAHKILNEDRLVKMRIKDTSKSIAEEAESSYSLATLEAYQSELGEFQEMAPKISVKHDGAKLELEKAVEEAGGIGSEKESLVSLIQTLEGQAGGGDRLRASKTMMEITYETTRAERLKSYQSAKQRETNSTALAARLPELEKTFADANEEVKRVATADLMGDATAKIDELTAVSAKAAKTAVDARMASKQAVQDDTKAGSNLTNTSQQIMDTEGEISKLSADDLKNCSKCGQPVDSSHIEKELAELNIKLADLKKKELTYSAEVIRITGVRAKLEEEERIAQDASDKASKEMNTAQNEAQANANAIRVKADTDLKTVSMELEQAKAASSTLILAKADAASALKAGTDAKEVHEKAIADMDVQIATADEKAAEARNKVDETRLKIATIDTRVATAKGVVATKKEVVTEIENEMAVCADKISSLKANIENMKMIEKRSKTKRTEYESAERAWMIADMASQAMDPKSGLPVHLIDERLPALADAVNSYLVEFGSPEFVVGFSTTKDDGKETLDILVDNGALPQLDVKAYSGGQLDRIEFCLRMALGDLAEEMRDVRLGFVMLDEPGTHLDDTKKGSMIRMLTERASDGRCPIAVVVSHDKKLMSAIPQQLIVTKEGIRI